MLRFVGAVLSSLVVASAASAISSETALPCSVERRSYDDRGRMTSSVTSVGSAQPFEQRWVWGTNDVLARRDSVTPSVGHRSFVFATDNVGRLSGSRTVCASSSARRARLRAAAKADDVLRGFGERRLVATDKGAGTDSAVFRAILQELKNLGAAVDGVLAETASLRDGMADLRSEMAGLREDTSNGFSELRAGFETLNEAQRETNAQLGSSRRTRS